MTVITPPGWQQAGSYGARTDRLSVISGLLGYPAASADEATPLRTRSGVKPSYQGIRLAVAAQITPNMTVQVSAGTCYVENKDLSGFGAYTVVNDATVNLTIAASSGSQFRKDTVCVQVLDAETLGIVNSAGLLVVQGPYAASAGATVRGTIPPNNLVLADVAVDAGVTSIAAGKVTDARQYQVASGGILPVLSTALPDHPAPGQVMYATDTDTFYYGTAAGVTKQIPSGGATGVGTWQTATKSVLQQVTNSATVVNDAHLVLPLAASATYELDGFVAYDGQYNAGDLKMDFTLPAGSSILWAINGPAIGGAAAYASQAANGPALAAGTYGTGGSQTSLNPKGQIVVGGTAGSLQCRWAQNTAHASTLTLYAKSWIRLHRIA